MYDQLNLDPRCHSDSEGERVSCGSPVYGHGGCGADSPYSPYNTPGEEQVYSEIAPPDTDQLIKPSHVKSRRSMYAGMYALTRPVLRERVTLLTLAPPGGSDYKDK